MTPDALLYLGSPDDVSAARLVVAHRPLAFRIVMAAVRAGARRVAVPPGLRDAALEALVARTPSARAAVVWLAPDAPPPAEPLLLLPASVLVTATALAPLVAAGRAARLDAPATAPVAVAPPGVVRALWSALARGEPAGAALATALEAEAPVLIDAGGVKCPVTGPADVGRAADRLLGEHGDAIDTAFDRAVHRRLAHPLSRWALAHDVRPNTVTLASITIGLAGAVAVAAGTVAGAITGLLLYALSVVLDHADGEVARLGFAESALGARLDLVADTVVHAAIVAAMNLAARPGTVGGAGLGVVAALGIVASAWLTRAAARRDPARDAFVAIGNRNSFYAMLLAYIALRAAWPDAVPAFAVVVTLGAHGYWIGLLARRRGAGRVAVLH